MPGAQPAAHTGPRSRKLSRFGTTYPPYARFWEEWAGKTAQANGTGAAPTSTWFKRG